MTNFLHDVIYHSKILIFRTIFDPTYDMSYEEKRRYYKKKDILEQRAHEEKIARIKSNINVVENRHTTYDNFNRRRF